MGQACGAPRCPNLKPCPDHPDKKPWEGSNRRSRTVSGSRQQKRSRFVLYRDDGICHVCKQPGADEADHVIPLSEGGEDHVDNMKAIHSKPCHEQKTQAEAQRARRCNG